MNKQQKTQRAIVLLLTLLCGVCVGIVLPCKDCRTRTSSAAISRGAEDVVAAFAVAGGSELPLESTVIPLAISTPISENLFAIEIIPTKSQATPTGSTNAASESNQPRQPTATAPSTFTIEVLDTVPQAPKKRVLIYHTHTYEAYEQVQADPYQETEQWRTADGEHSVVHVGEELAGLLRGLGMEVVHDATAFEPPNLSSAYTRSLGMLMNRQAAGEYFDLYIDLHRDAFSGAVKTENTVSLYGNEMAKLMLLIGKGEGQTSFGFDQRPDWQSNLKIAQAITDEVNTQVAGLCKDVRMKTGRFNQHISVGCMLVEVGNNHNTLSQALAAMPYLADAIAQTLQ